MHSISFEKMTLPNGLDVILHRDNSLPVVSVNVWYHVGSKDEQTGKTGYAHLFEHLMFEGSKHHNKSYFEPLQKIGANLNGSTTTDRTNYWENVPSNYLGLALWLESDRMGFLLDVLDHKSFDVQRDVVKNERRQNYENRPYGLSSIHMQSAMYPLPHPYHWPTIGFHEDLDVATVKDARDFFEKFYTPSNASLVIAGDIDLDQAAKLAQHYFTDIPAGSQVERLDRLDSSIQGPIDLRIYDKVSLPRLTIAWPTVPRFHPDEAPLSVLSAIMGDGRASRLYRSLVYRDQIAQSVAAHHGPEEIAGDFTIDAIASQGHNTAELEQAMLTEINRICEEVPSESELIRTKNILESRHINQMSRVGGFSGRANRLNFFNVFAANPNLFNTDLERYLEVSPEQVSETARKYFGDRMVKMTVLPEPLYEHSVTFIDRTIEPKPESTPRFEPPIPKRTTLRNGLNLLVLEKHELPTIAFGLILNTGASRDPRSLPGLSAMTIAMLREGTSNRTSEQIADEFEFMGSPLITGTSRERTIIANQTLSRYFDKTLHLVADLSMNPTFPNHETERIRTERLTSIRRIKDDATSIAERLLAGLVYGYESAYGHPLSGTEQSIETITRDDMVDFFSQNYGPENSTLVVVGDISIDDASALAEAALGDWRADSRKNISDNERAEPDDSNAMPVYLVDKPGAAQSVLRFIQKGIPRSHPDYYATMLVNQIFGGQFTARLNSNLRQDKGYTYGYNSWIDWNTDSSLMVAGGSVHTGVTKEAIVETLKEFQSISNKNPITKIELDECRAAIIQQFPSSFETPWQILEQLGQIVSFGLPDTYYSTVLDKISSVTLADVRRVAKKTMITENLALLIVGDRSVIEMSLNEINLAIIPIDVEGNLL